MRQLTINAVTRKIEKPTYYERIVCHCGHDHVYYLCPRCGMSRHESALIEKKPAICIGVY